MKLPRALPLWVLASLCLAGCATRADLPASIDNRDRATRIEPTEQSTVELDAEVPERRYPLDFGERLDYAHDWLYMRGQELVERTDHRFAPKDRELLPVPATPFRIGIEGEVIDRTNGYDLEAELDLDVTLRLPNIERRLRVFITSDDLQESPTRTVEDERSIRAGVRFDFLDALDFDIGVKAEVWPVAFTSLRWARTYELDAVNFHPFAKVYLESDEGFGVASGVTFDRWIDRWGLRASTYADWRKDEGRTAWTQTLLAARAKTLIEQHRYGSVVRGRDLAHGYGIQLLASGERTSRVDQYEVSLLFKRPARGRWLYWYVEPLVRWERAEDWNADPGIRIGFDALFWDLAFGQPDPGAAASEALRIPSRASRDPRETRAHSR